MESQQISDMHFGGATLDPTNVEAACAAASAIPKSPTPAHKDRKSQPHGPGSVVGNRYRLQCWLGVGLLGEIYEAVDLQLSEAGQGEYRVAIELIQLSSDQTHLGEQFASEFVSLLSISHPNIVRIIDFGIDHTTIFFTSELLEGASLRFILDCDRSESFTGNEVLAVLSSVADALGYMHAKGFVHGNLKPESIFVTSDYEVKIVDLASVVMKRVARGSLDMQYASPKSKDTVDDVFGLASVAYEFLSNERPFGKVPPAEALRTGLKLRRIKGVPRYRWKALLRALSLTPGRRTASIARFSAEFGITGTETLIKRAADKKPGRRRLFRPVLWLVVAVGLFALLQTNYITLQNVFSGWQERINTGSNTALPEKSESALPLVVQNAPATVEKATAEDAVSLEAELTGAAPTRELASASGVITDDVTQRTAVTDSASESIQVAQDDTAYSDIGPGNVGQNNIQDKLVSRQASASPGTDFVGTEPPDMAFAQDSVMVYEDANMASVMLRRRGGIDAEVAVAWWTGDNTAIANQDYANLEVRTETFAAGQDSLTIYVPLVSDSLVEETESFFIYVSWDSAPTYVVDRLEVFVIDDD